MKFYFQFNNKNKFSLTFMNGNSSLISSWNSLDYIFPSNKSNSAQNWIQPKTKYSYRISKSISKN